MVVDTAQSESLELANVQTQEQSLARVPTARIQQAHERLEQIRRRTQEMTISGAMRVAMKQRRERPSGY